MLKQPTEVRSSSILTELYRHMYLRKQTNLIRFYYNNYKYIT